MKMSTHREAQKADTRKIILDAAYSLFVAKGYSETTMRNLASQAGVGLGTIFKHFPDKPSLLVAAFQEDLAQIVVEAFATAPKNGIDAQLLHITKRLYLFYAENPSFSRTLLREVLFLDGQYGELLDSQAWAFLEKIAGLLNSAVAKGELVEGTDIQNGAIAYWSFYFTGLVMGLKEPHFDTKKQLVLVKAMIDNHFTKKGN